MTQENLPSSMKAWQYTSGRRGLENDLTLNSNAPLPEATSNEHLVKIIAVALNPIDYKPAEISIFSNLAITKPATPGLDFAGAIVKPALDSSLKVGQLIYGVAGRSPLAGGAVREYAIVKSTNAIPLPNGLNPIDAATIAVAGITAYQSILSHVKEGDNVFINGGSGGTGTFGIQVAKLNGCHVTTACSTANVELCKSLGADEVIDYKKQHVVEALVASGRKFDHAVENVSADPAIVWRSHEYLKPEAAIVVVAGLPASFSALIDMIKRRLLPRFLGGLQRKTLSFWPDTKIENVAQIGEWIRLGKARAVIDARFNFEDAPNAIGKLKTGRARGKIVIVVDSKYST